MREKLQHFMIGRYGNDDLNRFLSMVTLIILIVNMFIRNSLFYYLGLALLILLYFRMMSRNISARWAENQKFLALRGKIIGRIHPASGSRAQPGFKIYSCPQCKQKTRVPKGKGRIRIHCPKCGTDFVKRT